MQLVQLIYASVQAKSIGLQDARAIVAAAKRRNEPENITGLLVFANGFFLQPLEGGAAAVTATFARITQDPRHRDLRLLGVRTSDQRSFPRWSMRFVDGSGVTATALLRHSPQRDFEPLNMTDGQARGLLEDVAKRAGDGYEETTHHATPETGPRCAVVNDAVGS